ncbi:MAG: hypothetical protein GXO78_03395 [Calditrichaeota bacterium]|nr:hypothetical protein [Calditrichota bacterium]
MSLILLFGAISLFASGVKRVDVQFSTPVFDEDANRLHLELTLTNRTSYAIREARVYYREKGEANFNWERMEPQGFRYFAVLNTGQLNSNLMEYYFDIEFEDGLHQTYPDDAPVASLLSYALPQLETPDENIIIISPEPGEEIYTDELIITVSFPRFSAQIDKERIRLFLDTWEVSKSRFFQVFDDFLTFSPNRIPPGKHRIRLELYDRGGKLLARTEWSFVAHRRTGPRALTEALSVSGNVFLESRQEVLQDGNSSTLYNRAGWDINGSFGNLLFGTRLFLSNQERKDRQPVNRYSAFMQYSFWNNRYLRVDVGDSYPIYGPNSLQNIFVRGYYAQLFLKFLNLEFTQGYIQRAIDMQVPAPGDTVLGTYQRDLTAIRASFGARRKFQLGFSYLKGIDNTSSINGKAIEPPKENLVLGSDIYLASADQRFVLEGYVNASFINNNITGGSIPFDTLRSSLPDSGKGLEDIYNTAKQFITINQYLSLIPSLAYQIQARGRFFRNYFTIVLQSIEDGYFSMGQPYLLADYQGFSLTDNINLFRNQVFLTVGFQRFQNNVKGTKSTTTVTQSSYLNISYFPTGNAPSITIGFNNYKRGNDLDKPPAEDNTEEIDQLELPESNNTNTFNFSTSYSADIMGLDNQFTINLMSFQQRDDFYQSGNSNSGLVSFITRTRFQFPLITTLEVSLQQTESAKGTDVENRIEMNNFGFGLEYQLGRLFIRSDNLTAALNAQIGTVNSVIQNANQSLKYTRAFVSGRLIYNMPRIGRFSVNADFINYTGDQAYVDYIVTARYDISF